MTESKKPSVVYWIIGVVALLWNALGVNAYLQQAYRTEGFLAAYDEAQLALMDSTPAWVTALFAIAVFSGAIGALLLLLKKKLAVPLLLISFVAAFVQMCYSFFATNSAELFGTFQGIVMPILIIIFGAFLVWYSKDARAKGILS